MVVVGCIFGLVGEVECRSGWVVGCWVYIWFGGWS